MPIAAFWGKSVGFTDYYNSVLVETNDGRAIVVRRKIFEDLYYKLTPFTAAMKEDCIEYAINDFTTDLLSQPQWYVEAVEDSFIYEDCGMEFFYDEEGDIVMTQGSVILRNRFGHLKYMEFEDFTKYYEVTGSEFIES